MGSSLIEDLASPDDICTYTDIFQEVEPWYVSIGMTPDQFWNGPPRLAAVYRKAEEHRARRTNLEAWRMGQYVVSALNATVGNMFSKKGSKPIEYLKEPLPLTEAEVEERAERDARLAEQRLIERMNRLADSGKTQ